MVLEGFHDRNLVPRLGYEASSDAPIVLITSDTIIAVINGAPSRDPPARTWSLPTHNIRWRGRGEKQKHLEIPKQG